MNPQQNPDQPNDSAPKDEQTPAAESTNASPAEKPVAKAETPAPAASTSAFPAVDTTPEAATTATPATATKQPSKKKLLIIVAAVVLGLLLLAFAVFSLWYNKPENVVSDSFMKLATAKSSQGSGVLVIPSDSTTNTINFSYAQNEANEASGTASIKSSGSGPAYDVNGAFAVDKDQTFYVKVENLRKTLETMADSDPSAGMYLQLFDGIVDSVDSKWISISQADLQKLNGSESEDKELSCVEGKMTEFQNSRAQQKEVQDLFNKHPFLAITQKGTETVEGVYSNKYELKPDEAKSKEFAKGAKSLTVFKNIDGCLKDDLAKQVDDSLNEKADASTKATETIEYWVGVWSHEPVKLSVKSTADGQTSSLEFKPKLNTKPAVTIPKADKSIIQLQEELTAATNEMFGPMPLDDL